MLTGDSPRASSTFKVPDGSDSDMEYPDEETSNFVPSSGQGAQSQAGRGLPVNFVPSSGQGAQSQAGRGLSVTNWKGDVIDLTHPIGSGNVITNPEKNIVVVDQDDDYKDKWCETDRINAIDDSGSDMSSDYEPEYDLESAGFDEYDPDSFASDGNLSGGKFFPIR